MASVRRDQDQSPHQTVSSSWLRKWAATGQSWANQGCWWLLCDVKKALRRLCRSCERKEWKKCVRNTVADTKISRERRCSRCQNRDSCEGCREDHVEAGSPSSALEKPYQSRYPHWHLWKTPCKSSSYALNKTAVYGEFTQKLVAGTASRVKSSSGTCGQWRSISAGLHPEKRSCARAVYKKLQSNLGMKLPGKKGVEQESDFSFAFILYYPLLLLTGSKLFLPKSNPFYYDSNW